MTDTSIPTEPQRVRKRGAATYLQVMGVTSLSLFIVAGAIPLIGWVGNVGTLQQPDILQVCEFALYIAAGLASGGLLLGMASLLLQLKQLHSSFSRMERFQYEQVEASAPIAAISDSESASSAPPPETMPSPGDAMKHSEILDLLRDIRDNTLLSNDERSEKKTRVASEDFNLAGSRIRPLLDAGEFGEARELADALFRKYPDDSRCAELIEKVEHARGQHESEDVVECENQVNDLISISAWGRARDLAQQLQQRHPDSMEARQLLLRLERDHRLFQEEQRRRMNAEVQRFVTRRRWEEALAAAKMFIERFPGCEDTEAVRMQLPTLEANAEIEQRQRLEARIMEYARTGRYIEAVDLAKQVIERYPDSPQAEALRGQLARLEDLAENPSAPPARIQDDD